MIELNNVTLAAVSCVKHIQTIKALLFSSRQIKFKKTIFITDVEKKDITIKCDNIDFIPCPEPIKSKDDYSIFMLKKFKDYIDTDFVLLVQYDGFVLNPVLWRDEWLKYDYVGAPFPPFYFNRENPSQLVRVGNGGFSLRSRRFINLFSDLNLPIIRDQLTGIAEDHQQCCMYHSTFLENGIKYAPVEEAVKFSHENFTHTPEVKKEITPFGFHVCRGYQGEDIYDNFYYPYFA